MKVKGYIQIVLKDKRIIQWEYNNNGKFKMFIDDDIDWIVKKLLLTRKWIFQWLI